MPKEISIKKVNILPKTQPAFQELTEEELDHTQGGCQIDPCPEPFPFPKPSPFPFPDPTVISSL